jgi:uncharacterized protein (UPF0297 family)
MNGKTTLFDVSEVKSELVVETLNEVYESLQERGYNPINQIVGYLISGDPGYISSHKEARNKLTKLDRSEIVEILLEYYMENK